MRIVVNANILFAAICKDSITRKLLTSTALQLYSPEHLRTELETCKQLLARKTTATDEELTALSERLLQQIALLHPSKLSIVKATKITPDFSDAPYFALCLDLGCPLWSNDKLLKTQQVVEVYSTEEIKDLLSAS